jgi:hypothetical protein
MLLTLAATLMLATAPQADQPDNTVDPAIIESRRRWPGVVPTDLEIANQLGDALKAQPDKMICLQITRTGSRMPHEACKTLRGWYDFESSRDTAAHTRDVVAVFDHMPRGGDEVGARIAPPPHELVEVIKDRYRSPSARTMATERAKARLNRAPRSPADPPVSNP